VNNKIFHKRCKIQKLFNIWSQRDLSLHVKITIAKTLGLSKLIFVSACIHTPHHYIAITNNLITDFVWNCKKPKIKWDTLVGPKERGGLDLPEFETISKSLQTAWVQTMKNGVADQWMTIPLFYFTLMFLTLGRKSESKFQTMKSALEM